MPARASPCSTATCACSPGTSAFIDLYELPPDFVRVGVGLDEIIRFNAERGSYGPGAVEELVARAPPQLRPRCSSRCASGCIRPASVIEIRSNQLPDGGLVTTYTDVTDTVAAEEAAGARTRRWSSASASAPRS